MLAEICVVVRPPTSRPTSSSLHVDPRQRGFSAARDKSFLDLYVNLKAVQRWRHSAPVLSPIALSLSLSSRLTRIAPSAEPPTHHYPCLIKWRIIASPALPHPPHRRSSAGDRARRKRSDLLKTIVLQFIWQMWWLRRDSLWGGGGFSVSTEETSNHEKSRLFRVCTKQSCVFKFGNIIFSPGRFCSDLF